jgi:hypothetical protein
MVPSKKTDAALIANLCRNHSFFTATDKNYTKERKAYITA